VGHLASALCAFAWVKDDEGVSALTGCVIFSDASVDACLGLTKISNAISKANVPTILANRAAKGFIAFVLFGRPAPFENSEIIAYR
jgi:hypothetical protein